MYLKMEPHEANFQKCSKCKKIKSTEEFRMKSNKTLSKLCLICIEINKRSQEKNKCEHGKEKRKCVDCGGSQICEHNRQRNLCKDCDGASICEHNRQRTRCKQCDGGSICEHNRQRPACKQCNNPVEITIKKWLHNSRQNDKKYNRYNPEKFVTKEFLEELIDNCGTDCFYCLCELQYDTFGGNQATLERNYNDLGHNIDNVTIACHSCNVKHVGQKEYE